MAEIKDLEKVIGSSIFDQVAEMGHEQVVFCSDNATGLKAIIAIHNTVLGPSLGGTRMWDYLSDDEALIDALRLSRGMTYKAAITGLNVGGGKAVIIGDAQTSKTEPLLRRFGKFIDSLNGKYITAEDVNMRTQDMEYIHMETDFVTGLPESMGGGGDPSPVTAYGTYVGMKAMVKKVFGNDSLENKTIAVQGVGQVGSALVGHLVKDGAKVLISDISDKQLERVSKEYGVKVIKDDEMYDLDMDIYAPCALGATLNDTTIPRLKCSIVAGAANNQLKDELRHSYMLLDHNIHYAPDFVINAGGLINVYNEYLGSYSKERTYSHTEKIYDSILAIADEAAAGELSPQEAALKLAQVRIDQISNIHRSI